MAWTKSEGAAGAEGNWDLTCLDIVGGLAGLSLRSKHILA